MRAGSWSRGDKCKGEEQKLKGAVEMAEGDNERIRKDPAMQEKTKANEAGESVEENHLTDYAEGAQLDFVIQKHAHAPHTHTHMQIKRKRKERERKRAREAATR